MIPGIRITAAIGALAFGALLLALTLFSAQFERTALGFAKSQITSEMQDRFPALTEDAVPQGLQKLADQLGVRQTAQKLAAQSELPQLIGAVIANRCKCTPATEAEVAHSTAIVRAGMQAYAARLGQQQSAILDVIKGKYDAIIAALRQDVMIMATTNLLAFLAVLAATFVPTRKRPLLIYPCLLLLVTVGLCTALYLFNTDWFYAILYQSYYGWAYATMMLVIFAFLMDITLNYARVTLNILSHLPSALVPAC